MTTPATIVDLTDTIIGTLAESQALNYTDLGIHDRQNLRLAIEQALTMHIENEKSKWIVDDILVVGDQEDRGDHYILEKTERLSTLSGGDPFSIDTELSRRISRRYIRTTDRLSLETFHQAEKSGDSDTSVDRHVL